MRTNARRRVGRCRCALCCWAPGIKAVLAAGQRLENVSGSAAGIFLVNTALAELSGSLIPDSQKNLLFIYLFIYLFPVISHVLNL